MFLLQIVFFSIGLLFFLRKGLSLQDYCVFCIPFYATPLLELGFVSSFLLPVHVCFVLLTGKVLLSNVPLSKSSLIKVLILLIPFVVSLIMNLISFEPVKCWNIDNSVNKSRFVVKDSLGMINVSQMAYIVFGMTLFWFYSSLKLEYLKLKKTVDWVLYAVAFTGAFQVVAYYSGFHDVFKVLFNTLGTGMVDQMFIWGWKRISGVFQEPSYLGHFVFFSLCFYVLRFGYEAFLTSKAVWLAGIVGVLSTATTFYLGAFILLVLLYFKFSSADQKMIYYVIFCVLLPFLLIYGTGVVSEYIGAKESSTDERFLVSWVLAWDGIFKAPFFGYAYGTSRPLFIYTQFLFSIGVIGTLIFMFGILSGYTTKEGRLFLLCIAGVGMGAFELTRHEMWLYFGLLCNKDLNIQRHLYDKLQYQQDYNINKSRARLVDI